MLTDIAKDRIIRAVKFESRRPYGGQHAGIDPGITLTHDLFGIKIEMYEYRSQIDNRKYALSLFSHFLNELPTNIINALNKEYGETEH
jgi:protein subunit release factor A